MESNQELVHRIDMIFRGLMADIALARDCHQERMKRAMIKFTPKETPMKKKPAPKTAQKPVPAKKPSKGKKR